MNRLLSWLLVLLLFGLFGYVVAQALKGRADAGKGMPAYSVYSEDPADGLAATARLVRKMGWEPVAVTRPIQQTKHRGLLILVEPEGVALIPGQTPDLGDADVNALLRWVEQGNTLLLCGRHTNGIHRKLQIQITRDNTADEDWLKADPGEAGRYTDNIDYLIVNGRNTLHGGDGLPLWWLGDEPGAMLVRRGQGAVIVVADPSLLTLPGLERGDNVVFLYNVARLHARDGRVYFDEYHHGLRSGGGFWGYLGYHDQQWTVLPILLVVAVAGWSVMVRLGPAVSTPRELRADAVDYASAVARIYQRAGARHLLARSLAHSFLTALISHLRLRRAALPVEVLAIWRQRYPAESAKRLQNLLRGVAELRKGDVSERQLLAWARAFDHFRNEVLNAH